MVSDHTQQQSTEEQRRAKRLSLSRTQPPTQIVGYEIQQFLGSGAYGEVWVGLDLKTGRRVAIKFFTHRQTVDWQLLSREVEKLRFLSADRYVVQLLDIGWDTDPPHYVMEYIEQGSLEDLLKQQGRLPVREAVEIFRDVTAGLSHAHAKGVLHCDVKPANILLDQDGRPRLADFGQARLSSEQKPALGTLFYMAPEQADLEAVPDARWDVYALGVVLYYMLTGELPYRDDQALRQLDSSVDLAQRLAMYRHIITTSPPPQKHRKTAGVDRALADLIDRCLTNDPRRRLSSVQGVLDALQIREHARARRPLVMLGFLGPILLLIIGALFAWRGYQHAMQRSSHMVTQRVIQSNKWAARSPAGLVANKIDRYFGAVQRAADDPALRRMLLEVVNDVELAELLRQLNDPRADEPQRQALRERLEQHPARQPLQRRMEELLGNRDEPTEVASWFITDGSGTHLAADFRAAELLRSTIGHNYAYRTYFHGGNADLDPNDRPPPGQHVRQTHLSALLQSTATDTWKVAVSTPIYGDTQTENELIGVLAMTIDLGKFMRFDKDPQDHQLAVLVDGREGPYQGVILQHPLFEELLEERGMSRLPERFSQYRVPIDVQTSDWYRDPLGEDPLGQAYRKRWIVATAKVRLDPDGRSRDEESMQDSGLFVLVMEDYDESLAAVRQLGSTFLKDSVVALLLLSVVVVAMWYIATRRLKEHSGPALRNGLRGSEPTPLQDLTTLAAPRRGD